MKQIIIATLLFLSSYAFGLNNLLVIYPESTGASNQLKGVINELNALDQSAWFINNIQDHDTDSVRKVVRQCCQKKQKITLLTADINGLELLMDIKNDLCSEIIVVNTSHMIFDDHLKLLDKLDLVALPKHAVDKRFLEMAKAHNVKVAQTIGVAHNVHYTNIRKMYDIYEENFTWLNGKDKVAMFIIGGDAHMPNGGLQLYSEEEAVRQANLVGKFCKDHDYSLMIFNGYRTGLYDPKTILPITYKDNKLDNVTRAFVRQLSRYLNFGDYKLYKYSSSSPFLFNAGYWVVKNTTKGICFVPGESVSTISEAIDNLPGKIVILKNSAMNQTHDAYVKEQKRAGRAIVFERDITELGVLDLKDSNLEQPNKNAARIIAEAIADMNK
jgi:hypothetical protein